MERPSPKGLPSHIRPGYQNIFLALALRTILLFVSGMAYGVIIMHLQDDQRLAPVKVTGIKRDSWAYLIYWGIAGVGLGSLLPWVDVLWEETLGTAEGNGIIKAMNGTSISSGRDSEKDEGPTSPTGSGIGADWNPVVRSIGAFVGIAFAIVSPCCPLHNDCSRLLMRRSVAEAAMAIYSPGLSHPRAGQSSIMVSHRPLQTRFHPFDCGRSYRYRSVTRCQSRNGAFSCNTFAGSKRSPHVKWTWVGRDDYQRNHWRCNMDRKRDIL